MYYYIITDCSIKDERDRKRCINCVLSSKEKRLLKAKLRGAVLQKGDYCFPLAENPSYCEIYPNDITRELDTDELFRVLL
jgi:hypothetical protein